MNHHRSSSVAISNDAQTDSASVNINSTLLALANQLGRLAAKRDWHAFRQSHLTSQLAPNIGGLND